MNGSVQKIKEIPDDLKLLYRTVWEIPQKHIVNLAASRGPYIDQSQSLNIFFPQPTFKKVMNLHFYGWGKGLKTGNHINSILKSNSEFRNVLFEI